MAITKLLRIKAAKSGSKSAGLRRCLEYVCRGEKTEGGILVGGNCGSDPAVIYEEMCANKAIWGKEDGSQGFHYVISFPASEAVDEEIVMQVAEDFCRELLQDRYLYCIAVHTDRNHLHAHIVFDSVSYKDGTMYHSGQYDWHERIQPITDKVCQRHGLSVLEYDEGKERIGMYHAEWEEAKLHSVLPSGKVSWNDLIRDDIDDAIRRTDSWSAFLRELENRHYDVRDGKYLSVKPEGKDRAVRTGRLGEDYTKESLMARAGGAAERIVSYRTYGRPDALYRAVRLRTNAGRSLSPMEKRFFVKWMKLSHFRKPDFPHSYRYRQAATRLDRMAREFEYMVANDLTDMMAIEKKSESLKIQEGTLLRARTRINNRNSISEDNCAELVRIREELKAIRTEQKLLQEIVKTRMDDSILFERGAVDVKIPEGDFYTRITVDRSLFTDVKDEEGIVVRLPGQEEKVVLIKDDSRYLNAGTMLSSYIYNDLTYPLIDKSGEIIRQISGQELKTYFEDRTRNRERGSL